VIFLRLLLCPVASDGLLTVVGCGCRQVFLVVGSLPTVVKRPLRTTVNVRVVIIEGDRIKMHARGNEECIIVLRVSGHRCDKVILIDYTGAH